MDVRNQVNSLAKKGKPKLRELFDAAKEKGTQGKREFFYNVFLLDPDVAKKVAKLGLKQVYAEVRLLDEDTDERRSTTEACQRLQDEDMTAEQFEHVENALRVAPEAKQFMLGAKGGKSAKTAGALPDKEEEEPEKAENAYKKYYGRLTGSLTFYGNAKLLPKREEQREERIKSLEKALEAYKKNKNQWMEKIGTLASSLEEGLEEETANAKVENVQNIQKELEGEVAALRKNLQAQKQLWSQIPQSA